MFTVMCYSTTSFMNGETDMGNIISFNGIVSKDDDSLSMSNGLTDVFIDVLLVSGSELADSESEKRLIVYLAEKQQTLLGIGTVDFDIIGMPWAVKSFETDKKFILRAIECARQKQGWEKLEYNPNFEHITYALNGFESLVNRMTVNDIDEKYLNEWIAEAGEDDPVKCGYPKCPKHGLILSFLGCKLCNDRG